ncbi:xanthine dehydrogenase accessory factor [Roseibium hamelinense]|uniref:Xanthine dehydrogenase accessory factor n=1 Tax=Roseibium hamelinense TaxID=150831 RepID=A0A562TI11_9HYPH|nr:xanthine dehydrogenase accessory protein XdhC [Roseibium hamelinense]MTI45814.1 xanthine dehydrogenase accessory protein XdhC [Roseibium hamelinense]TWI93003.1 xanthine dehydrogenase accessory factor [Roseibium hamelinense]
MRVWGHIANTLETGSACALVTVAAVKGSTPREPGARMIVRANGGFFGTIGGGTLEFEAIRLARSAIKEGYSGLRIRTLSLGPDLGQCCGGRADIALEVIPVSELEIARDLAEAEASGGPVVTFGTVADGQPVVRKRWNETPGEPFDLRNDGALVECFGDVKRPLFLFGAGHVGKAAVLALAPLPFKVTWIDPRPDIFPAAVPANVTKILCGDPALELERAPSGAFILVMTHSHALDEQIVAAALKAQRFDYCGVIGSQTKRARFRKRLQARGLSEGVIANMVCPVGHPDIKSKHPAAIAAGIAADLLHRNEAAHQQNRAVEGVAQFLALGQ